MLITNCVQCILLLKQQIANCDESVSIEEIVRDDFRGIFLQQQLFLPIVYNIYIYTCADLMLELTTIKA